MMIGEGHGPVAHPLDPPLRGGEGRGGEGGKGYDRECPAFFVARGGNPNDRQTELRPQRPERNVVTFR